MKDCLYYIVSKLVNNPDQIAIEETEIEDSLLYTLTVAPEDMGKVIGRQGRIANAIRVIMKTAGAKTGKRISVEIK